MFAARLAFAGLLIVVLSMFIGVVLLVPIFVPGYTPEAAVIVPLFLTLAGMILALVGIESQFWRRKGDE